MVSMSLLQPTADYQPGLLWHPYLCYNKLLIRGWVYYGVHVSVTTRGWVYYGVHVSVTTDCSLEVGFIMASMSLLQQTVH